MRDNTKLVLFTNRKCHTDFKLLPKLVILNGIMTADAFYLCTS